MAKNNNLTDFLTDIANAIRTKKGTQALIDPQNFSSEIASISGGGSVDWTTMDALLDELQIAVGTYPVIYSITNTLSGCTTNNNTTSVETGSSYSATITANNSFTLLGATVSITMGGNDITSTAYSNGTISIASVTGNVVVSISAVSLGVVAYATAQSGVTYTAVTDLSSYTDARISEISKAISNCQNITNETETVYLSDGTSISVGATRSYTLSTQEAMTDRILGFNHDELWNYSEYGTSTVTGKAGITWMMVDCLATKYEINDTSSNAGGWDACELRTVTLPTIKATMPLALQNIIVPVIKDTANGGGSNYAGIVSSIDDLFLLSEIELNDSGNYSEAGYDEGARYEYYTLNLGNSGRVKYYDNAGTPTTTAWWTRSSYASVTSKWTRVSTNGSFSGSSGISASGISFAYCT